MNCKIRKMTRDYYTIYDEDDARLLQDADNAVTECNLWDWLKTFTPEEGKGFMHTRHENLDLINSKMKLLDEHSGASYAITMRTIEFVAKEGWDKLYDIRIKKLEEKRQARADALNNLRRS